MININKVDIFNAARELFEQKGFKQTSISDITKKTGIGVGSFYKHYESKEEVFLDVFLWESEQMKKRVMAEINLDGDPVIVMKEIVSRLFSGIRENAILREWYKRDVYNKLAKFIYDKNSNNEDDYSYNLFMGILRKWQEEGKIRKDIDSELILNMFNSLQYIDLHKEEIGNQYFPHLMDCLVEFIVKGLQEQ
ncbi:UNVERIFIED_CONTAM: TetR family transcriptional regulator [Acetivibrio alkalicellulosi]